MRIILITGLAALTVLTGCAGGAGIRPVPDWVLNPPGPDDQYEYFVVSADNPDGNVADAEEQAGLSLMDEINRVLGVDVSLVSDAEERASLDAYEAEVRRSVKQTGSGVIAGLRIADRYVQRSGSGIVIYILASYERDELNKERDKREALLAEKEAAVNLPEEQGSQAEARGDLYDAFLFYVQAAVAASSSDIRNAAVKLDRNLQNAQSVLARMRLEELDAPDSMFIGAPQPGLFTARLSDGNGHGIPNGNFLVSWRETVNGRSRQVSENIVSDGSGELRFALQSAGAAGQQFLTMNLDINPQLENLRAAGLQDKPQFGAIRSIAADLRLRFEYQVVSQAPAVPTALLIVQRDIAGNDIEGSGMRDGILQELVALNFTIVDLPPEALSYYAEHPDGIKDWVKANYSGQIERLIFGQASISEVDERDGFIVKVRGSVEVYDLDKDRIIDRITGVKNSQGSNSARAISSAFFNLGRDFGEKLIADLP